MDGLHTAARAADDNGVAAVKLLLTVDEACAALGIKKTLLYSFLATGELFSVKVGGRRLVPLSALYEFVARLADLQRAS